MKTIVAIAIVMATYMLAGCDSTALPIFNKPQPDQVASLTSFPRRLQGKYIDSGQTSILTVTDNMMTRKYDYHYAVLKDSLPGHYRIEGNFLIDTADGSREPIILKGDTVTQHMDWTDTVFNISSGGVLKKFKGYHFLNFRYDDSTWGVSKLSLKRGVLTIGNVSAADDIQQLREITETTDDTTSMMFSLTKRQFKEFIRHNGFDNEERFTRIRQ